MSKAVYINNVAAVLPNAPVANNEMENVLGMLGGKPSKARRLVLRSNGIKQRYYAIDPATGKRTHSCAQLTAEAIKQLACDEFSLSEMDALVAATSTPDQALPNHAVMVHGELGEDDIEVVATSGICTCGMTAMKYGYLSVLAGEHSNVVSAATEVASLTLQASNFASEVENIEQVLQQKPEIAFEKDFLRWMLSDASGAVWMSDKPRENGLSLKVEWIDVRSYAHQMEVCMYAGAEKVDGELKSWTDYTAKDREKMSLFAVKQDVKLLNEKIVPVLIEQALAKVADKHHLVAEEIDYFLPHYSSEFFRERLLEGMQNIGFVIPQEKWFTNLTSKGNTGSASIYVMLDELFHSGKLQSGEKILCFIPESGRFTAVYMLLTVV